VSKTVITLQRIALVVFIISGIGLKATGGDPTVGMTWVSTIFGALSGLWLIGKEIWQSIKGKSA